MSKRIISVCVLFSVLSINGRAQTLPKPNDPELYVMLLHITLDLATRAAAQTDPGGAQAMSMAIPKAINLSNNDAATLLVEARQDEALFISPGHLTGVSRATATTQMVNRLQSELSPAGWNALRSYVNGEFRNNSFVMQINH